MNDFWQYSTVHNNACKVIEEQTLWGQTVCRVWLPNQDAVVRVPRSTLRPLNADLQPEFEEYKEVKKKLKVFRLEAVRAGFKKAWQERDYAVIVAVADKIPNNVLEEDPKLLMWYDQAVTRMGGE
ncbi:MAG: hypothetical protein ACWGKN_02705 [Desulfoprunum sp.]|jgi:hypothetical protein|nr:hypothetical protein JT06_17860 [Desulfobulbus sp. Tol-SR]